MTRMQVIENTAERLVLTKVKRIMSSYFALSLLLFILGICFLYLAFTIGDRQLIALGLFGAFAFSVPLFLFLGEDVKIRVDTSRGIVSSESRVLGRRILFREVKFRVIESVNCHTRKSTRGLQWWIVRLDVTNEDYLTINSSSDEEEMLRMANQLAQLIHQPVRLSESYW